MANNTFWHYTFLYHCSDLNKPKTDNLLTATKFDLKIYLYSFVVFLFSLFFFYLFQYSDLSNLLLRSFDSFWLSFVDTVKKGTYNFVSLIVKIILLGLTPSLSLATADKIQCFVHLIFNSALQIINGITTDRLR